MNRIDQPYLSTDRTVTKRILLLNHTDQKYQNLGDGLFQIIYDKLSRFGELHAMAQNKMRKSSLVYGHHII